MKTFNNEVRKNVIKINEGQIHRIVAESVKMVLREAFGVYDRLDIQDFSLRNMQPGTKLGTITVPSYEFCDVLNLPDEMYDKLNWRETEWDFEAFVGEGGSLVLKPSNDFVRSINEVLPGKMKKVLSLFTNYMKEKIESDAEFRSELEYFADFGADPNDFR